MARSLISCRSRLVYAAALLAAIGIAASSVSAESLSYSTTGYGSSIQPVAYRSHASEEAVEETVTDVSATECLSCNDGGSKPCCSYSCYCWYVSLGGAWSTRETVHEVGDPATFIEFNEGFAINGAIGHDFQLFRLEFEYSYFNNQVALAGAGISGVDYVSDASGNISVKAYMLNAYYDFDFGSRLKPYVGGGIGLFQSEINSLLPSFFVDLGDSTLGVNTTSDVAFAYQFRAGLNYELTRRTELYTGYRFFDNADPLLFAAAPFGVFYPDSATFHNFEAGLRVKF